MKLPNQKGFALAFILVFIALMIAVSAGVYYLIGKSVTSKKGINDSRKYITVEKALNLKTYDNQNLSFQLTYPKDLILKEDTEEEFDKRGNGDFRKNFRRYVQYEPGKFLGGVVVLDKSNSFDTNPFTLWVFDNPNDLTIDGWYKNYWYYPFVWGDFTYTGKVELAPKEEATISGQMAKSGVIDYQPGKPKFVYVSKDKKMYLFRIIREGDKVLPSFKFL